MTFRRETNVGWAYVEHGQGRFLQKKLVGRYRFLIGNAVVFGASGYAFEWEVPDWQNAMQRQWQEPLRIVETSEGRQHWIFRNEYWWDDEQLTPWDVHALIADRDRQNRATLERAHRNQQLAWSAGRPSQRPGISKELKKAVFDRDGGRYVSCGSNFDLQYDHIIPFDFGGATTFENLQLLCSSCNQTKGASFDA